MEEDFKRGIIGELTKNVIPATISTRDSNPNYIEDNCSINVKNEGKVDFHSRTFRNGQVEIDYKEVDLKKIYKDNNEIDGYTDIQDILSFKTKEVHVNERTYQINLRLIRVKY